MTRTLPLLATLSLALLPACSGGGGGESGASIPSFNIQTDLTFCRGRQDNPHNSTEIRVATRQGLGNDRGVTDRSGIERGVRVHPDGAQIVFSRERQFDDPNSRELYWARLDGAASERRLTVNQRIDDSPCWSSDGSRVYWSSEQGNTGRRIWWIEPATLDTDVLFDDGSEQRDPDVRNGLMVYSRHDPLVSSPRQELWLLNLASGTTARLTDGGAGTSSDGVPGDFEPAISPNGTKVLFTRSVAGDARQLMQLDIATLAVTPLGVGDGDARSPRWTPDGEGILVTRSRPLVGMPGRRLYELNKDGSEPVVMFPDKRYEYFGFDALPTYPSREPLTPPVAVDMSRASAELAFSTGSIGSVEDIYDADGQVLSILSGFSGNRQVAGLRLFIPLLPPGATQEDAESIRRIDVQVRAALSRNNDDTVMRLALENLDVNRNDSIVELRPADASLANYGFSTQSLAHVSRTGTLTLTIIGDMPDGDREELAIDQVTVTVQRVVE